MKIITLFINVNIEDTTTNANSTNTGINIKNINYLFTYEIYVQLHNKHYVV